MFHTLFKECVFTVSAMNSIRVHQQIFRAPHPKTLLMCNMKLPGGATRPSCLPSKRRGGAITSLPVHVDRQGFFL